MHKRIELHGHRGFRGRFPENTIAGFIEAIKAGAEFLEMDVVVSRDKQLVVSHEPWMNEIFCIQPDRKMIDPGSKEQFNLYKMDYAEISAFDCGTKTNPDFPLQRSIAATKPLLSDVIKKVDEFTSTNKLKPAKFNIEIKTEPGGDNHFHPAPKEFVQLLLSLLAGCNLTERFMLQSFDVRILQEIKQSDDQITLSLLVENQDSLEKNLQALGFLPDIYGPEFILVDERLAQNLKDKNIRLIPWTINEAEDIRKMIELGVDGIITDYPDKAKLILSQP